jgi:hypothetical protein
MSSGQMSQNRIIGPISKDLTLSLEVVEWFQVDGVFDEVEKYVTGSGMCQRWKRSGLLFEGPSRFGG